MRSIETLAYPQDDILYEPDPDMTMRTSTALALAALCILVAGCDSSDPIAEPPLELGVFEAEVSGGVTESIRGDAVFEVDRTHTGDLSLTLLLYGTAEPGGEPRLFRLVYAGVPEVGAYAMPGPGDPYDADQFRGGYGTGVSPRHTTTGGSVDIQAISEEALEGAFDFVADRDEDDGLQGGEVRVVGRFHAEEGDVGDS